MKSYIKYPNNKSEKAIWIEVEVLSHSKWYGRDICTVKPVNGEGELSINSDKVIVK